MIPAFYPTQSRWRGHTLYHSQSPHHFCLPSQNRALAGSVCNSIGLATSTVIASSVILLRKRLRMVQPTNKHFLKDIQPPFSTVLPFHGHTCYQCLGFEKVWQGGDKEGLNKCLHEGTSHHEEKCPTSSGSYERSVVHSRA